MPVKPIWFWLEATQRCNEKCNTYINFSFFCSTACHEPVLMGLINYLALALSIQSNQRTAVDKSWQCRESNLGPLGVKFKCYLCAMEPPYTYFS